MPEVSTLYVVDLPQDPPGDTTGRALRILGEVALVAADDVSSAQLLLSRHGISKPLFASADVNALMDKLGTGDVAVLSSGRSLGPSKASSVLIHAAIERGFRVAAVPGPTLPVTALVISGMPADSFIYLGVLPKQALARNDLLSSLADEHRTLLILESPDLLPNTMDDLRNTLGDRPLVLVEGSAQGTEAIWRGRLDEEPGYVPGLLTQDLYVLVIGGAREKTRRWDENRLRAEVQARRSQGLGAKEISRQLVADSGWPQRDIYRLAVEAAPARRE